MSAEATDNEEMFLVEGRLTALQTAQTTVNLLEQIEKHAQAKNIAGGVAAAASGMYGMVANAAALTLYEGEDLHNFAAMVGKEVLCGTFGDADRLEDGDNIKAVVSRRGDVLYAHCVLRKKDQQLLLPLMTFAGEKALFRHCMSVASWLCIGGATFFGFVSYLIGASLPFWLVMSSGLPLMAFPFEIWSYRTVRGYGYYASAIFEKLGVPRPDDFDARKGITSFDGGYSATNFELALKKHSEKFKIAG
jgi:hypothetical protein